MDYFRMGIKDRLYQKPVTGEWFSNKCAKIVEVKTGRSLVKARAGTIVSEDGPGLHIVAGLGEMFEWGIVLNKTMRTYDNKIDGMAITNDGVPLTPVDFTIKYQILNGMKALGSVNNYFFYLKEAGEGRIRSFIGHINFDYLSRVSLEEITRGEIIGDEDQKSYSLGDINTEYKLKDRGLYIESLELVKNVPPASITDALTAGAAAAAEAKGMILLARAGVTQAEEYAKAAKELGGGATGMDLKNLDAFGKSGEKGNATVYLPGNGSMLEHILQSSTQKKSEDKE